MNSLSNLIDGFGTALQPEFLLYCAVGVLLGTAIGVLPGIGPALTIALLLPLTYDIEPTAAFIMFAGIYYGAMYGGSTSSILLNTPGESASVVTALEGFQMAKRGRGGAALATAAIGSFVAGTLSTILITFIGPTAGRLATKFQPADYCALMVLAFVSVAALVGRSALRGLISLGLGLFVGLVGIDQLSGSARFTFGQANLLDGIDVVVVAVGLFAVGEALHAAAHAHSPEEIIPVNGRAWLTRDDLRRSWKPWLRGTAIGFPMGCLPAGGAEVPTFLSYGIEKQLSKNKEEFGKGAIEGVAGPEAANNAAFGGVLVPLLTLGLPTSATAAIMLTAFQSYNIQPGPNLFDEQGPLLWALIASMYIGNVMLVMLNLPLVRVWVKLLAIPRPLLYACILVFATLGVFSASRNPNDLYLMVGIGVVGYGMRYFDIPVGPMVLGLILGPLIEAQLRRTLSISQGDWSVFVDRPLSLSILIVALLAALVPHVPRLVNRLRGRASAGRLILGDAESD
ncbi:MAG: tripartite tricarboxylate transporter permease [Actinomycetota bacterium]|nr:tripartite tricarboxylate transporter permease [Actinomycetota bacterium]